MTANPDPEICPHTPLGPSWRASPA